MIGWRNLARRGKIALVALGLLALIALLPMRLALAWSGVGERGVSARAVSGSIWHGRIADARLGGLPLGDLRARLRPLPLLAGRTELSLSSDDALAEPAFSAVLASSGGGAGSIRDARGTLSLGAAMAPLPINAVGFTGFNAQFANGKCVAASGELQLILAPLGPQLPLQGAMQGKVRCDKGALYVPMTGPTGMERLLLRIEGDGRWRGDLLIRGLPAELAGPLRATGLLGAAGGLANGDVRLQANGRF